MTGPRSRRSLPKSRAGCHTCKSRKIKCDEQRPSCRNCRVHRVTCGYLAPISPSSGPTRASSTSSPTVLTQPSLAAFPITGGRLGSFSIQDLELLHHFTTSTCLTLTEDPLGRNFWRIKVPQMGFVADHVLHGILSLAALHLAHFRPERSDYYIHQAVAHNHASSIRALPLINNLDDDNCVPVYMFSMITSFYAIAKPKESSDLLLVNSGGVPDWLFLFRGMRSVVESREAIMTSSTVAAIFQNVDQLHKAWESDRLDNEPFQELDANIRRTTAADPGRTAVLLEMTDNLRHSFAFLYQGLHTDEDKIRATFTWLYKVSEEYLDLLRANDPEALCVLGFFCILIRRIEFYWWLKGWSSHLMKRVHTLLDEGYRMWLRWPIEEMGWVSED